MRMLIQRGNISLARNIYMHAEMFRVEHLYVQGKRVHECFRAETNPLWLTNFGAIPFGVINAID
jgi:hypothetical protein